MYQGKRSRKTKYRKSIVVMASLAVLLCATVGGTLAWLVAKSGPVTNTFTPGGVSCAVSETFPAGATVKKDVSIKNTGNVHAYIRAYYVVTWKDSQGNVYGKKPVEGTDYEINLLLNGNWTKNGTYYYYKLPVAPEDNTGILIDSCNPKGNPDIPPEYKLSVEIIADAIQSEPENVIKDNWGFDPTGGA